MQCGGLGPVALLLQETASGAHSHKEPGPCKLGADHGRTRGHCGRAPHLLPSPPPTTSTCLPLPLPQLRPLPSDTQLLPASLYPPPPAQKLHVPPSTPHNFYLLSIKIGLGLDGADGGCGPAWPLRPLAQRASCQEQSQEGHSPRGQHGGGGRVAGLWEAKGSTTKSQDRVYSAVTEPSPGSPCPSVASPSPALGQPHPPPPASS